MITVNCISGVDVALKNLKKRMQQELRFSKMKEKKHFESKAEKTKRKISEVIKRKVKISRMLKAKAKSKSKVSK